MSEDWKGFSSAHRHDDCTMSITSSFERSKYGHCANVHTSHSDTPKDLLEEEYNVVELPLCVY